MQYQCLNKSHFVTSIDISDYIELRNLLIMLIGSQNVSFKSSTTNLNISVTNLDSYREVVRYLKISNAAYPIYQAYENKKCLIVIRNMVPSSSTSKVLNVIKSHDYYLQQVTSFNIFLFISNPLKLTVNYSILLHYFIPKYRL